MIVLIAVSVTVLSLLGTFLYGLIAGIRVALRLLIPLIAIAIVVALFLALLSGSKGVGDDQADR